MRWGEKNECLGLDPVINLILPDSIILGIDEIFKLLARQIELRLEQGLQL